jgi:GNAT superfamily N-acetyltransferase
MAAQDNLGRQFSYQMSFTPSDMGEHHKVTARLGETRVGFMKWDPDNGVIKDIQVHPEHRRKGVATAMWNFAQSQVKPQTPGVDYADDVKAPQHSTERTPEGDAWAKSVGGRIPKQTKATTRTDPWK